jgi:hypothetical protein
MVSAVSVYGSKSTDAGVADASYAEKLAETHPIPFLARTDGLFMKDESFFALLETV